MSEITDGADYVNALAGHPIKGECDCCEGEVIFIWPKLKGLPMPRENITVLCPDCFWAEDCHGVEDTVYIRGSFADEGGLVDGYEEFNE